MIEEMNTEPDNISKLIQGKRIAGIDYGRKRVGMAVCDEMHIPVSPRKALIFDDDDFMRKLSDFIASENIGAIVVGVPYRSDNRNSEIIDECKELIENLRIKTGLPVFEQDEAFSSKEAMKTMINIGKKRKYRKEKGNIDSIAASIILRDFLNENEGYLL